MLVTTVHYGEAYFAVGEWGFIFLDSILASIHVQ